MFHIGPERDLPIFDGLGLHFVPLEKADYVVCTGLRNDEVETPESYRAELGELRRRRMFMLCGNPDLVVERGERLIYCAGALADLYGTLGGEVLYAGKPHRPIYDLALQRVAGVARRGAAAQPRAGDRRFDPHRSQRRHRFRASIACSSPPASMPRNWATGTIPNLAALNRIFADAGIAPKAVTRGLAW